MERQKGANAEKLDKESEGCYSVQKTSIDFFERVREDKTFQLIINPFNTIEIIS